MPKINSPELSSRLANNGQLRLPPAEIEMVGESPSWRRERVEYSAGYDDERMFAWLFLPKASRPELPPPGLSWNATAATCSACAHSSNP